MGILPLLVDKLCANNEICNANMSKNAFEAKIAKKYSEYVLQYANYCICTCNKNNNE